MSVKVIDEIHLNNQRAFILFNEFFESNQENLMSVKSANHQEVFAFPNLMNMKNCKFIKYGHYSINQVLEGSKPHYYSQSVL
jgi:hypothetical protein